MSNIKKRFTTIMYADSAFGGHEFRVTSNNAVARIQCKNPGSSSFRTVAEMPFATFESKLDEKGKRSDARVMNVATLSIIADEYNNPYI